MASSADGGRGTPHGRRLGEEKSSAEVSMCRERQEWEVTKVDVRFLRRDLHQVGTGCSGEGLLFIKHLASLGELARPAQGE